MRPCIRPATHADALASDAKTVTYGWDWTITGIQRDQLNSITYPSGSRKFDYTYDTGVTGTWYDQIGRMTGLALNGGSPIIHYDTTGGGRNIIQTWGDASANTGVRLDYDLKTGNSGASKFDRFGRIKTMDIRKITNPTTSTRIHKYEYGYDGNGNRIFNRNEQVGHIDERDYLYGYDRLNRLIFAERGELVYNNGWLISNFGKGRAWGLDLMGNWSVDLDTRTSMPGNQSVIDYTPRAAGTTERGYTQGSDDLNAFTHHDTDKSNAIKSYSYDDDGDTETASVDSDFHYDDAGNLVLDDKNFYKYDAWNRVVVVHKNDDQGDLLNVDASGDLTGTPGTLVATYEYDALGRRIAKTLGTAASPTDYFYYDGHRVIEHHEDDGTGVALNKQYVYGLNYIDEPVAYYDADAVTGLPVDTPHFILRDANYGVVGITDDQGTLVQQMSYEPYGIHLYIEDGNGVRYHGVDADISALFIPKGRNGLWYDPETGLYYNRARYYDPALGRFRQADPNGTALVCSCGMVWGGRALSTTSSLEISAQYSDGMTRYGYLRGQPSASTDPSGLCTAGDLCYDLEMRIVPGYADPEVAKLLVALSAAADAYDLTRYTRSLARAGAKKPIHLLHRIKKDPRSHVEERNISLKMAKFIDAFQSQGALSIWYRYKCNACIEGYLWNSWETGIESPTKKEIKSTHLKWKRCPVRADMTASGTTDLGVSIWGTSGETTAKLIEDCEETITALTSQRCATTSQCPK